jgi:glycogen debranching enzyme
MERICYRRGEGASALREREWLVTNGLGGYASGTVSGVATRRYHGLLIAALPTPFGRTMMFNHIWERLRYPDGRVESLLTLRETSDGHEFDASRYLIGFHLEDGLPVWTYEMNGVRLEKRVMMPHLQNTTHVTYTLIAGPPVRLELRPLVAFRLHEAPVSHPVEAPYLVQALGDRFEIAPGGDLPPLAVNDLGEDTYATPAFADGRAYVRTTAALYAFGH